MPSAIASFDQRPGALEATRGLNGVSTARLIALGKRGEQGWTVAVMADGVLIAELTPAAALTLAAELTGTADVLVNGWQDEGIQSGGLAG